MSIKKFLCVVVTSLFTCSAFAFDSYWDPKVIDLTEDDITVLNGFRGTEQGNVKHRSRNGQPLKTDSIYGWSNTTSDRLVFEVNAPVAGDYNVAALITSTGITSGNEFRVSANGTSGSLVPVELPNDRNSLNNRIWFDAPIFLNAGLNSIDLRLSEISNSQASTGNASNTSSESGLRVLALEIVKESAYPDLLAQEALLNADTSWFTSPGRWGLMVHYSPLRTPSFYTGELLRNDWERYVNGFDVDAFADKVEEVGASYVILTIFHGLAYLPAPSSVVDSVISGRTTERDLIGELADELDSRGKRLMLYFHANVTEGDTDLPWKEGSGFYDEDPQVWNNVIYDLHEELSLRYGTKLWGTATYFDTTMQGPFQHEFSWRDFTVAAKAGNPDSIIGLSNQKAVVPSMFGDVDAVDQGTSLVPGDLSRYDEDVYYGVQAGSSFRLERRWYYDVRDGSGWGDIEPVHNARTMADFIADSNENDVFLQVNAMIAGEVDDETPFLNPSTVDMLVDMKGLLANHGAESNGLSVATDQSESQISAADDDLAQSHYSGSAGTGGNDASQHAQLFNGSVGNTDGDTVDSGEVALGRGNVISVDLDTAANPQGYDIDRIDTIFGGSSANGGRANQGYSVSVSYVDGSTEVLADPTHWEPNSPSAYWTRASLSGNGSTMATGVESLSFEITNDANRGGTVVVREIDVFGEPSGGGGGIVVPPSANAEPLAHWAFDATSGTTIIDSSGNGFNATAVGPQRSDDGVDGGSLGFDGTNGQVDLPVSTFAGIDREISVSMWVKGSGEKSVKTSIFGAHNASGGRILNIHLPWSNGDVYWDAGNSTGADRLIASASESEYSDDWNHWVFTKNAGTGEMKIYVNGQLKEGSSGNFKPIANVASATIGGEVTRNYYDGGIDDFRIYDVELSAGQVSDLYNDTAP